MNVLSIMVCLIGAQDQNMVALVPPGIDELGRLQPPEAGTMRLDGVVKAISAKDRVVTVESDSGIQTRGIEYYMGKAQSFRLKIGPDVPVRSLEDPKRWIKLRELTSGDTVGVVLGQTDIPSAEAELSVRQVVVSSPRFQYKPLQVTRSGEVGLMEKVKLEPFVFPVTGRVFWLDTWLAPRGGGSRQHIGQDLMAPKMRPIVAPFDGWAFSGNVEDPMGWTLTSIHINNDTPGTDDGRGGNFYAIAAGTERNAWVKAGEIIAWVGDSGNAEGTAPHLHMEIRTPEGGVVNPAFSLKGAKKLAAPLVFPSYPELLPARGKTRFEGIVTGITNEEVQFSLINHTENGSFKPMVFPVIRKAEYRFDRDGSIALNDRVIVVGSDQGKNALIKTDRILKVLPAAALKQRLNLYLRQKRKDR
jgi:hypothetical protein